MSEDMIFGVEFPRSKADFDFAMHTMQEFYSNYERGLFTDPHRLFFNAIIYISHGHGRHFIDHQVCHIKPGTLLFVSKYQAHRFDYNPDIRGYIIPFCDNILFYGEEDPYKSRIRSAFEDINFIHEDEDSCGFFFEQLWTEYKKLHCKLTEEVIRNALRTLVLKTLVRRHQSSLDSNHQTNYSADYCKFHKLIKTHFVYTRTLEKYAGMMGLTTKKLNQIARENTGKSGKELIDSYAMLESKRLLAYSQEPISSIALKLGFSEPTNLTKFFKKHSGLTPKEFRNLCLYHGNK
ncbi:AraC family transcriptional regulator [uncultured Shewanella sp.]|uniref:helix-turn-helix domain-containing protein n=1 Tax=uncultured Shewanella sp. TaxID=173975 RepID=UPI0026303E43|nr:AraC family transcriptional regulator [uncultured Shewanella sp.]